MNAQITLEQAVQAIALHGGNKAAAARELGIPRETLRDLVRNVEQDRELPITGKSTLIDRRTNLPVLEWVKTRVSKAEEMQAMEAACTAFKEKLPVYSPVKKPHKIYAQDLLNLYVLTDYHLGMLAWGEETGAEDCDLKIAEETLIRWFQSAISLSPDSEIGVFANLGDFLHWDGLDAVTPQHGNLLDADTRFQKLIRVAIRVQRQIIAMLERKHRIVHVIYADANHDPASGAWMREWLDAVYTDDPCVIVENSADSYYCIEHGKTMIGLHHGHKRKIKDLDRVIAGKFPEAFGRTKYRYAHLGHLHSDELFESPLMRVERHRTLAAPNAYAAKGGWISGRDAKVITYSKRFGEVSRVVISPEMAMYGQGN